MKKGILFLLVLLACTYTSWTFPLNLRNVQECKQMVENFISDRNTGYQITFIHLSGGGMANDPNDIRFEINKEGKLDINITYVQRMYFQIFRIIIEKKTRESISNYISFMKLNNGSSQDFRLFFDEDENFMVKQIMNNFFESLGY